MPSIGVFGQGGAAKLYLPVRCVDASSHTNGYLIGICGAASLSFDGNQAVMMDSDVVRDLPGFIGVANGDIAVNGYGLAQCFGLNASIHVSQQATSITINIGDPCVPAKEPGGCISVVPTYALSGFKYIMASGTPNTTSLAISANYMAGLIRCF